ncbi:MAG TPA: tRNA lysidine(34) synthetase TilS [Streptosporangiaceae bacterium]
MGPHPAVAQARSCVRRCLADLAPGDLVLAACSGGADSLALAAALAHEVPRLSLRGGGVTVDHGLQAGSAGRAARVAALLGQLGLDPVHQVGVAVPAGPGSGGPEAAARDARYAALEQVAEQAGAVAVLLGHSRDDQAETVLLGLARGAGGRALAGMPAQRGRFRRPLLGLARATLREACTALGLEPWDDPHNTDPAYTRARIRHQAMPALEAALGPGVAAALARTAAQLSADCDALDAIAAAESWRIQTPAAPAGGSGTGQAGGVGPAAPAGGDGTDQAVAVLDIEGLAELAPAIRSRVLRQAALTAGCPAGSLAAGHIAALDALVTGWHGQRGADLPGVIRARRRYGKLLFSKGRPAGAGPPAPTEAEAAGGRD